MIGGWERILLTTVTAVVGVTALAASLSGYLLRPARLFERFLLFGAAIVLIKPGLLTDLVGFGLLGAVILSQQMLRPAPEPVPDRAAE
jgi:TRAP-type uncharacterized transport system fused permease subunit